MSRKTLNFPDLILNPDGSIYHLNLLPEDLGDTVITVGDPDRVGMVSKYLDRIEVKKQKREFVTHTGCLGKKRISIISTGIGAGNIDIVLNELDILANTDLKTREPREKTRSLQVIRIGTSGSIRRPADVPVDSLLLSTGAFGLDATAPFYPVSPDREERHLEEVLKDHLKEAFPRLSPYFISADAALLERLSGEMIPGITATLPGFYLPQGRGTRLLTNNLLEKLAGFRDGPHVISNFEMETAPILAIARHYGHRACSVNAILANRLSGDFSKHPGKTISKAIRHVLERL